MLSVYTDGGSRGNPGHAAFGFVIKEENQLIKEDCGYLGIETNNFAEYTALIRALSWLSEHAKGENIHCFLDSQLVVSQLSGSYKVKNLNIKILYKQVKDLEANFANIIYKHIPRAQNIEADKLVNIALDRHLYGNF